MISPALSRDFLYPASTAMHIKSPVANKKLQVPGSKAEAVWLVTPVAGVIVAPLCGLPPRSYAEREENAKKPFVSNTERRNSGNPNTLRRLQPTTTALSPSLEHPSD